MKRTPLLTYAIGDVHGCRQKLEAAMRFIVADHGDTPCRVVFLGDYADRGPDTRGVYSLLMQWVDSDPSTFEVICLKGNHDEWVEELYPVYAQPSPSREEWNQIEHWMKYGGEETLNSYMVRGEGFASNGLVFDQKSMDAHLAWIKALPLYLDDGERIFVHSAVHMELPLDDPEQKKVMLWVRPKTPPPYQRYLKRQVVHGHTPCGDYPRITPDEVNLDTGAVFGGKLTVAKFTPGDLYPIIHQF